MNKLVIVFSLLLLFFSCKNSNNEVVDEQIVHLGDQSIDKQFLIDANKNWIKDESFLIDQFCARHNMNVILSETGVRYYIYAKKDGASIEPGDVATISYEIRLLDADTTLCYSSGESNFSFVVEMDNIESGLHEAITYFKKGEQGFVVLPHYLAHGLIGNMDKIPPLSPVLYKLHLIDVYKK